jgi:RNA polymerase sigma-70 factor, ECF subfamily
MGAAIAAARRQGMESIGCTEDFLLIRDVQGGNLAAFEQLVYAHDQSVLGLALRITGSQIDAQDIYQETFLKAFKNISSFRYECAFSTWIYRIATNVCLDHLRKKHYRNETSATEVNVDGEEYDALDQLADNKTVSNRQRQVLRRELGAHISRALKRLTPRERMVFELRHHQGLTLRTVGKILNCSETATKHSLFRATQKLRLYLAGSYLKNNSSMRRAVIPAV